MNTGSSTSYRRAPGETTEWEDILISKGIIAPKTDPEEEKRQAALEERLEAAAAAVDPLKNLSLSELDELEVRGWGTAAARADAASVSAAMGSSPLCVVTLVLTCECCLPLGIPLTVAPPPSLQEEGGSHSDDNKVLESYRAARLAQLQAAAARNKYGAVSAACTREWNLCGCGLACWRVYNRCRCHAPPHCPLPLCLRLSPAVSAVAARLCQGGHRGEPDRARGGAAVQGRRHGQPAAGGGDGAGE